MFVQIYKWLLSMFYFDDSSSLYIQDQVVLPDFDSMTKAEIQEWASQNYGVSISKHLTKSKMISKIMELHNG